MKPQEVCAVRWWCIFPKISDDVGWRRWAEIRDELLHGQSTIVRWRGFPILSLEAGVGKTNAHEIKSSSIWLSREDSCSASSDCQTVTRGAYDQGHHIHRTWFGIQSPMKYSPKRYFTFLGGLMLRILIIVERRHVEPMTKDNVSTELDSVYKIENDCIYICKLKIYIRQLIQSVRRNRATFFLQIFQQAILASLSRRDMCCHTWERFLLVQSSSNWTWRAWSRGSQLICHLQNLQSECCLP